MIRYLAGRLRDHAGSHIRGNDGPAVSGSLNVRINNQPALREGDRGVEEGSQSPWRLTDGAVRVLINDRRAQRTGDTSTHIIGQGYLVTGSPNVMIGNFDKLGKRTDARLVVLVLLNELPLPKVALELAGTCKNTDNGGKCRFEQLPAGDYTLSIEGVAVWSDRLGQGTSRFLEIRFLFDLATCCTNPTRTKASL